MGACTFFTTAENSHPREAFGLAREEALFSSGHGGYTGTIAEKDDFVIIQRAPLSAQRAREFAERLIADQDPRIDAKWGPAGALPIASIPTHESQQRITLDLGADDRQQWDLNLPRLLAKELRLGPDESVIRHKVVSDNTQRQVKAQSTSGALVDRYYLTTNDIAAGRRLERDGLSCWPTLAQARQAAIDAVEQLGATVAIHCRRERESGPDLAVIQSSVTQRTLVVEATISKDLGPAPARPDSWLFFGWASS